MLYKLKHLSKYLSSPSRVSKVVHLAVNDPKIIYKYLTRIGSKKWINNIFDSYGDYIYFKSEIEDSKFVESLEISLKEKFKNISGETVRGNYYIPGTIKKNHVYDIYSILRKTRPSVVIETGVCNGFSSAIILQALKENSKGHLYSIDYPEFADSRHNKDEFWTGKKGAVVPSDEESGWLVPQNLRNRWTLIIGKSQDELLPLLNRLKGIDIFFHDSEHSYKNQMFEFKTAFSYLNNDGILIASDINWNNSYEDFLSEVKNRSKVFFLDYDLGIIKKN